MFLKTGESSTGEIKEMTSVFFNPSRPVVWQPKAVVKIVLVSERLIGIRRNPIDGLQYIGTTYYGHYLSGHYKLTGRNQER